MPQTVAPWCLPSCAPVVLCGCIATACKHDTLVQLHDCFDVVAVFGFLEAFLSWVAFCMQQYRSPVSPVPSGMTVSVSSVNDAAPSGSRLLLQTLLA